MKTLIDCSHGCSEAADAIRQTENPEAAVYFVMADNDSWGVFITDCADVPLRSVKLGTIALFHQLDSEDLNEVEEAKKSFFRHFVCVGLKTSDYDFRLNLRAAIMSDALLEQFR